MPHVHILGTHHYVNSHQEEFKYLAIYQDVLYHRDYAYCVVASFSHQIKSEYYGGNISVTIEGVKLEHFSASDQGTSS